MKEQARQHESENLKSKIADLLFKLSELQPEDLRQYRLRQLEKYLTRLIELKYSKTKPAHRDRPVLSLFALEIFKFRIALEFYI